MTSETGEQPPSVVLVGPPGAGKSTIGRKLARELGVDLYDTDAGIEEQTGRTIPEIFAEDGEPEFRRIEEQVVRDAVLAGRGIVSLGGGSVLSAATRELLRGRTVVYLEISVGEGLRRTGASTNRPLLNGADPAAKYRELMKIRRPLYREVASVRVRTDGRSPGRVVRMILGKLGLESTLPHEETTPELPPEQVEPTDSTRSRSRRRRRRGRGRGDKSATTQPNATAAEADSPAPAQRITTSGAEAQITTDDSAGGPADSAKPARRSRRSRRRSRRPAGPAAEVMATDSAHGIDGSTANASDAAAQAGTGSAATPVTGSSAATPASGSTTANSPRTDGLGATEQAPGSGVGAATGSGGGRRTAAASSTTSEGGTAAGSGGGRRTAAASSTTSEGDTAARSGRGRRRRAAAASDAQTSPVASGSAQGGADAASDATDLAAGQQDSAPGAGRSRRARARRARARARISGDHAPDQTAREESEQSL